MVRNLNKLGLFITLSFAITSSTWISAVSADSLSGDASVRFNASDNPSPPVDPDNPDKVIDPGEVVKTEGPLRLDFVPKLSFGYRVISDQDQRYNVKAQQFVSDTPARPNYIQLTDNRWNMGGWRLTLQQEKQFYSAEAKEAKELKGAVITFNQQSIHSAYDLDGYVPEIVKEDIALNEMGASYTIVEASENKGPGTWVIKFGASDTDDDKETSLIPVLHDNGKPLIDDYYQKPVYENTGIRLSVPGSINKEAVKYSTVLVWTLSELT
ncbi:WxL domain-containing protein [Vagococcus zengguangii]|uniref:WxL domain-containing protein n=1 Tax=Vagococcus zengguangii TaxID=2571750 RepID=A0A4D7CS59_9ENTE|nr:WxL domain-containing protein [Vagococcus zengguangii]QCI85472.1 WxL domain-containing protein [Vagococcus zengguangii]TLG80017.1 WxL domain-containing protein [Vagococcus zengguangii]